MYGNFVSRRHWRCLVSLLMVATASGLMGCGASGPDFHPPKVDAPADWTAWRVDMPGLRATAGKPASEGWELYGDARLIRLQALAMKRNSDLRIAALHYAQSLAQMRISHAEYAPEVDAVAGITRQQQSDNDVNGRTIGAIGGDRALQLLGDPATLRQAGFDASWELDLWGRVRRTVEAANAGAASDSALLDDAQLSVSSAVAQHYFAWQALQQQIQLAQQQITLTEKRLYLTKARSVHGLVDSREVMSWQSERDSALGQLPELQARQSAELNQLALLVDRRPAMITSLLTGSEPQTNHALPDLSPGLPADIARDRPDIAAAEARLHEATAQIGIAVADLYPRITLGASFGYTSTSASAFDDWRSRDWSVGPTLSLPIFDYGRRRTTVTLRDLQAREAAVAWRHTVLAAWQDVDDALSAYGAERQRNVNLQQRLEQQLQRYDIDRVRYQRGLSDELALLDSQSVLLQAEQDKAISDGLVRQRMAVVIKAVGGKTRLHPLRV